MRETGGNPPERGLPEAEGSAEEEVVSGVRSQLDKAEKLPIRGASFQPSVATVVSSVTRHVAMNFSVCFIFD